MREVIDLEVIPTDLIGNAGRRYLICWRSDGTEYGFWFDMVPINADPVGAFSETLYQVNKWANA